MLPNPLFPEHLSLSKDKVKKKQWPVINTLTVYVANGSLIL